ncbi:hypothetical protein KAFR_0D04800 [Kazachstania africana CBS 2517]|uniref:non-specific serine/threonine protein kinase n=1 Tax=Kazachstania africana (strain ATCC 22294 / BCRC 22015 / CBS 2517 / CECT 1963 / NBRC 1671 / NRRL Y-8276) TaxID=1071382 RepID=H2AUS7_KAZAF|nr:hypothetical protein KAFR_0D04800 [Kazachstania africana CBS 2517]CCF58127.1 hypothetical protein KAFR_0D04800 [Kazachstania africana CBS 2517]
MSLDYEIYKEGGVLNNRYQKIEDISEGSYGYVSLAKDINLKKLVAIKYIFDLNDNDQHDGSNNSSFEKQNLRNMVSKDVKDKLSNRVCLEAMYEIEIQNKIGLHKNITALLDYFDSYIIMEYCSGGDLYEAIKDDIIPRKTKLYNHMFNQILDAIEFVHKKSIFHRDIKPENILINNTIDWTIKLTDWGLATVNKTSMNRNVGSERYMAPELFESNLDINERREPYQCDKIDLWAIGIVFLNVVFHKNPFKVANQSDKSFCYFAANREALFDVFSTMAYDFFQVLRYCLTIDPDNRDLIKMRYELANLSEFTLDDDYYNKLEDGYDTWSQKTNTNERVTPSPPPPVPPSSAPVNLPSPIASSKPLPKIEVHHAADEKPFDPYYNSLQIPKFTNYNKQHYNHNLNYNTLHKERAKSAPRSKYYKRNRNNNNNNINNNKNDNYYNSHYNNLNNYLSKGVKIEQRNKSKIIKNSRKPLGIPAPNSHINNYMKEHARENNGKTFNTKDFFTPPSVHNRYMEGYHKKNRTKHRRPSTTGNKQRFSFSNNNVTSGVLRRGSATVQHSPGTYIPPNARSNIYNSIPQVLTTNSSHSNVFENDMDDDDILFTLDENNEFINNFNDLSITNNKPAKSTAFPDLLKSPVTQEATLNTNNAFINPFAATDDQTKFRPGKYVLPHHRKQSSMTEATKPIITNDVFNSRLEEDDDDNVLIFEDEDDDDDGAQGGTGIDKFGPYQIYDNETEINKFRKFSENSSKSQEDKIIGSLETYKNNWIIQQD